MSKKMWIQGSSNPPSFSGVTAGVFLGKGYTNTIPIVNPLKIGSNNQPVYRQVNWYETGPKDNWTYQRGAGAN